MTKSRIAAVGRKFALATCLVVLAPAVQAEVTIRLDQGVRQPIPSAVTNLGGGGNPEAGRVARALALVLAAGRECSGLFNPIDRAAVAPPAAPISVPPRL